MKITRKQLKNYITQLMVNESRREIELGNFPETGVDQDLMNSIVIYRDLTNYRSPDALIGADYRIPTGELRSEYDPNISSRTKKTRGNIASNVFNNVVYLHEKSEALFVDDPNFKKIYQGLPQNKIPAKDSNTLNRLDVKIRNMLGRQADEGSDFLKSVFGNDRKIQREKSHDLYCYRQNSMKDSIIIKAYNSLNLNSPAQVYHYVMENCLLDTGDDVEIGIAHYFFLLSGLPTEHIDGTGTDLRIGSFGVECKSSAKANNIEAGLHASFPEDNRNKFYAFISNRGSATETQVCLVNSKLLRFILLFPDIYNTINNSDSEDKSDGRMLHDYINKYGNNRTSKRADYSWIRKTILDNSTDIINNFIDKTTTQFQNGNAEDFNDTVTFSVGNAKVMVRTQVSWGLSALESSRSDSGDNEDEIDVVTESLLEKILLELIHSSKK